MEQPTQHPKSFNSKGGQILKKMLEDKRLISEHLRKGGKLSELKDQINFAKPVSFK